MPRPIEESVVVITGASSGIGRATARAFARRGAKVVLAGRAERSLHDAARECQQEGAATLAVPTEVTDEASVQRLARRAVETFGRIDVWVNNAGVTALGRFEDVPAEVSKRVIEINLLGCMYGARTVIPLFRKQKSGVLINIASLVGKVGQPYAGAYVASKFGIIGLSQCLREELRDVGDVHVCTVLPGPTDTPIFQQAANYSGRAIQPPPPVDPPETVADAILSCVEAPQPEVSLGGASTAELAHWLAPEWTEQGMATKVEREHFQDRPAAPTVGNLYRPTGGPGSTSGGWKQASSSGVTLGDVAVLGLLGLGLWATWPRADSGTRERSTTSDRPSQQPRYIGIAELAGVAG